MENRLEFIKAIHQQFKKKPDRTVRVPRIKFTPEESRARRLKKSKANKLARRSAGCCSRCDKKAVVVHYVVGGVTLLTKLSKHCIRHWEIKSTKEVLQNAIHAQSAGKLDCVATPGIKPNASVAG